jgi:cytosine/adenosine deaminase-related metal-dependent hydrolase/ubiquinone/menaquinone biosynthesis C-methylase UbiE
MSAVTNSRVAPLQAFDIWASIYDEQNNPMFTLEERHLEALLPALRGKCVFEAGCGTGRWLGKLATRGPESLSGIDASSVMLDQARRKLDDTVQLHLGDCSSLPASDGSVDVLLSSFVLSYLLDLDKFVRECSRVLRPGGVLLLSDLNSDTASSRGWSRSFRRGGEYFEVPWFDRSLALVVAAFQKSGFSLQHAVTPAFNDPERPIFERSGKLEEYEELQDVPAIYILKLQKECTTSSAQMAHELLLTNVLISSGPDTVNGATVNIEKGRIAPAVVDAADASRSILDLSGLLVLPGLINAHDHLEFALFPNLGREPVEEPYRNATEWSREIHSRHADIISQHRRVPKSTRLWWGAIRNLLCGVTTVCHHNPAHPDFTHVEFPVRVVSHLRWSHSLVLSPDIAHTFCDTPSDAPFIVHAAEGVDVGACGEIARLEEMSLLDDRTVLVHGLGVSEEDVELINSRNTAVIACPSSNQFLFHQSPSLERLNSIRRIALGSDSPLTGAGDLLDEIRYAHGQTGVSSTMAYEMVTRGAAAILRLRDGEGEIIDGGVADLIAVRTSHVEPALAVAHLRFDQIELMILSGNVQVASAEMYERLPQEVRLGMQLLEMEGHMRWVRAPLDFLFASAEEVLGKGELRLGGKAVRHVAAL